MVSRMRKAGIVLGVILGSVLSSVGVTKAATVTALGVDVDRGATWRSTNYAKPAAYDVSEDYAYGSDGYYCLDNIAGASGRPGILLQSLPVYITSITENLTALSHYTGTGYSKLDDPTQPIGANVADMPATGLWFTSGGPNAYLKFFTITLAQSKTFVLTTIMDTHNTSATYGSPAIKIVGPGGIYAEQTGLVANKVPDYVFFQINGNAGDAFEVWVKTTATNGASMSGLGFEAPLPPHAGIPTFSPDGGTYAGTQSITISCATPDADIYYTTDGSEPTQSSTPYTEAITISQSKTLKAKAWATGMDPSSVATAIYLICRPAEIPGGTVTVDGNLTEWASSEWAPLDQAYYGSGTDLDNASCYAVKWAAEKVYVAVKVLDGSHHLADSYGNWATQDNVEIYLHTTGVCAGRYDVDNYTAAQQYTVGIKTNEVSVWSIVGLNPIPTEAGFQASGKVEGDWLIYEVAMTPFQVFNVNGQGLVVSPLNVGDTLGVDVVASSYIDGTNGYMKSENLLQWKSQYYTKIGLHKLVEAPALLAGDANGDGMVDVGDLGILAANYGGSEKSWAQGDFNDDGLVDVGDLGILAANYGTGVDAAVDFSADYAKAFGTTVADEESNEETGPTGLTCSALGLPLISGLLLACLGLMGYSKCKE